MMTEARPRTKYRDPLEPINTIVSVLLWLVLALAVLLTVASVFGSGSFLGFGHATPTIDVPLFEQRGDVATIGWHVRPDTFVTTANYQIDVVHPDLAQRIWFTLMKLPDVVVIVGGLLLAYRIINRARRDGIYTPATARRIRVLGWLLVGAALVGPLVVEMASNRLLATLVTNHVGVVTHMFWDLPWVQLIFGATLLSIARIMRIGAEMNSELEATV